MPNEDGMGLAVDIACTTSQARYETVDVAIKFFRRIGIAGEHSGNFIHLDVDPYNAGRYLDLLKIKETPLTFSQRKGEKGFNCTLHPGENKTRLLDTH